MRRTLALAGRWYPADTDGLDRMISTQQEPGGLANGVLPHAGLLYSAPLIAGFFGSLAEGVRTVMILSPSHYYPLKADTLYSYPYDEAETPYGDIGAVPFPLPYRECRDAVDREHGIEMFLPFVKKKGLVVSYALLTSFSSFEELEKMGMHLAEVIDDETALIASSDFTHYGKRFGYAPYGSDALEKVEKQDFMVASALAEGRVEDVFKIHRDMTICGSAPAMLLSYLMAESGDEGFLGKHYTSYDVYAQDADDFVSYFDVFWRRK